MQTPTGHEIIDGRFFMGLDGGPFHAFAPVSSHAHGQCVLYHPAFVVIAVVLPSASGRFVAESQMLSMTLCGDGLVPLQICDR
jgi:hypothetical protein